MCTPFGPKNSLRAKRDKPQTKMLVHLGGMGVAPRRNRGFKEARAERSQFGRGALNGPAGLQSSHDGDVKNVAPQPVRWHTQRKRDVEAVSHRHAEEIRWRYTDDFNREIIDNQLHAAGGVAASEFSSPIAVARHSISHGTRSFVAGQQQPPSERPDSQHL